MDEPRIPQIEGKVLYLVYGSGKFSNACIENPTLEMQAGRLFLTGRPVYLTTSSALGESLCVAWDSVKSYFIFDSVEHCRECKKNWGAIRDKQKKTHWWQR